MSIFHFLLLAYTTSWGTMVAAEYSLLLSTSTMDVPRAPSYYTQNVDATIRCPFNSVNMTYYIPKEFCTLKTCRIHLTDFPNSTVICPPECPYRAPCSYDYHVRCIRGTDDRMEDTCSFYDPVSTLDTEYMKCSKCEVKACEECRGAQSKKCAKCLIGFSLSDDGKTCADVFIPLWYVIYALTALFIIGFIIFVIALERRPITSPETLKKALEYRDLRRTNFDWKFWKWHTEDRLGPGVALFFNFYLFAAVSVLVCLLAHFYVHAYNPQLKLLINPKQKNLRCDLGEQPYFMKDEEAYRRDFTMPLVQCSFFCYVSCTILAMMFSRLQKKTFQWFDATEKTPSDFAVMVENTPLNVTAKDVETVFEDFLQVGPDSVVGASMSLVSDKKSAKANKELLNAFHNIPNVEEEAQPRPKPSNFGEKLWHRLDRLCGFPRERFYHDAECEARKKVDWSRLQLRGCGTCIVVLSKEEYRDKLLAKFGQISHRPGMVNKLLRGMSGRLTLADITEDIQLFRSFQHPSDGENSFKLEHRPLLDIGAPDQNQQNNVTSHSTPQGEARSGLGFSMGRDDALSINSSTKEDVRTRLGEHELRAGEHELRAGKVECRKVDVTREGTTSPHTVDVTSSLLTHGAPRCGEELSKRGPHINMNTNTHNDDASSQYASSTGSHSNNNSFSVASSQKSMTSLSISIGTITRMKAATKTVREKTRLGGMSGRSPSVPSIPLPRAKTMTENSHLQAPHLEVYRWRVKRVDDEPESILWNNFGKPKSDILKDFLKLFIALCRGICIFSMLYLPYLGYSLQTARVQNDDDEAIVSFLGNNLTGLIISFGVEFIVREVLHAADQVGAIFLDRFRVIALVAIFFAILVTVIYDVILTLVVLLPQYVEHFQIFSTASERIPTRVFAASEQLFEMFIPGYLIVPYLLEPFTGLVWPYWLCTRMIRSGQTEVSHAQQNALLPEVDVVWPLSDVIVNCCLSVSIFFFITDKAWQLWLILFFFVILRYFFFILLFTRFSTVSHCDTDRIPFFALRLWGIMTGLLAAAACYWSIRHAAGLRMPPLGLPGGGPISWDTIWYALCAFSCACVMLVHNYIYWMLTKIPNKKGRGEQEEDAVTRASCIEEEKKKKEKEKRRTTSRALELAIARGSHWTEDERTSTSDCHRAQIEENEEDDFLYSDLPPHGATYFSTNTLLCAMSQAFKLCGEDTTLNPLMVPKFLRSSQDTCTGVIYPYIPGAPERQDASLRRGKKSHENTIL